MSERIVITGLGVVAPVGIGVEAFHRALSEGRHGISELEVRWQTGYETHRVGLVQHDLNPVLPEAAGMGRCSQLGAAACKLAMDEAGLAGACSMERIALVVGTALGDAREFESEWEVFQRGQTKERLEAARDWMRLGRLNERIASCLGLEGPSHLVTTACAAGNHALAWGVDLLKTGVADAVLAAGADTVGFVDLLGFCRLLLQAPVCCQPFDLYRKGTILSEGGAAVVLETELAARRRGAPILAELAGYGLSCDAAGSFASDLKDTRGLRLAVDRAMRNAGVAADEIQHVSAHGSGTKLNDNKETRLLKEVLGEHAYSIPVNAIKSMLGHAQGAAAMFEAIASVLTINRRCVYPTMNYETPDPACDLDYVPNCARDQRVDTILSNAFGVGGNNATVIMKRWQS